MTRDGVISSIGDRIRYWGDVLDSIDSVHDNAISKLAESMGLRFKPGKGYMISDIRLNIKAKCKTRLATLNAERDRLLNRGLGVEDKKHEGAGGRA